jgi:hypothetical protein
MGEHLDAALAGCRCPRGLRLRRPGLGGSEESAADVVGDLAVERLAGPIEPELPGRRGEDEIHLQALLHTRAPVLEIDRPGVLEHLLPFLRSVWIPGDVAAAVEVGQFTVADNLQRLEHHHAVAPAERVGGACHELPLRRSGLARQPNHHHRQDRNRS